jgi:23S rRNA (uracil1939-C5)-methyltransferase
LGRQKLPFFENITISDVGAEGKAIVRINDIVTFVSLLAPGDIVDLQVTKKRSRYMEAMVTHIHKLSEKREIPVCKHFGICGGCKWQHLPYSEQLNYKQKQVADALLRIGKIDIPILMPILGSKESYFYRNKLEFAFSNKRWFTREEIDSGLELKAMNGLGFHLPGHFDRVVDIEKCWLQADPSNSIRNEIKKFANESGLPFFNPRDHDGFFRNLIIRTSKADGVMVILTFYKEDKRARESLLEHLTNKFPEISSLMYAINNKGNDTLYDQEIHVYSGKDHIIEYIEDLKFKIGPKSFFQTNTEQAFELYRTALDFAGLTGNEVVYDLYSGTGTIAIFVARKARKVIGIESVPEAITDSIINSEINGIRNTTFFSGDMKNLLTNDFFAEHGKPDIIITDPPRAGMHQKVVESILDASPAKIVYVSCNPATQARDIALLSVKYKTVKSQPVDMFPQTHHVENVALLVRI